MPTIEEHLEGYINSVPGYHKRIYMRGILGRVVADAYKVFESYETDLENWPNINVECKLKEHTKLEGTLDLIFSNPETKKAHVVDWKYLTSATKTKIRHYTRGLQPIVYTLLAREYLGDDYDISFEYRIIVGKLNKREFQNKVVDSSKNADYILDGQREIDSRVSMIRACNIRKAWPRNPDSCYPFGSQCRYYDTCWSSKRRDPERITKLQYSYSLLSTFDECPHRYAKIMEECQDRKKDYHHVGGDNNYSMAGNLFHVAMAHIYRQALKGKKKGRKFGG